MSSKLVNKSSENTFIRDESKIKYCPAWAIYSMPFVLLALCICLVMGIKNFGINVYSITSCIISIILIGYSKFVDIYYDMYEDLRISFVGSRVLIQYKLNSEVMPSSNVIATITVIKIDKIKLKKNSVVIKGLMQKEAPLKKAKKVSKVVMPINFIEKEKVIQLLKKFAER